MCLACQCGPAVAYTQSTHRKGRAGGQHQIARGRGPRVPASSPEAAALRALPRAVLGAALLPLQCVADASVSTLPQIKASEAKEAAKNKPAETKQPASVAKKTTPSRPAESTPRATTGGKTMGAKGRAGQILAGGEGGRRQ
jgi:hypothetical protein